MSSFVFVAQDANGGGNKGVLAFPSGAGGTPTPDDLSGASEGNCVDGVWEDEPSAMRAVVDYIAFPTTASEGPSLQGSPL